MRFFGKIGFEETSETSPGIWEPTITYRDYIGDVNRNQRRWQDQNNSINDDVNISNEISVVADSYILENLGSMKCVEFGGAFWKISWINVQYPRVVLTLGGVYTFETPEEEGE